MSETSYHSLHAALDEVLAKLQDPTVDVDESVKLYEQGAKLIAQLEKHLQTAENKLTKLKRGK